MRAARKKAAKRGLVGSSIGTSCASKAGLSGAEATSARPLEAGALGGLLKG